MKRVTVAVFVASVLLSLSSCASVSALDSPYQRHLSSETTRAAVRFKSVARQAADQSTGRGALIFVDPQSGELKNSLLGNSPLDAWLKYAAAGKTTDLDKLPLPSSISPTAIFVFKSDEPGKTQIVYSASFDEEVKRYYDLSATMLRIGGAIQDLRDITILLSISDKKQNEALQKIQQDFKNLGQQVQGLTGKLQQLSADESHANLALSQQLNSLSKQLDQLQTQISKIK